MKLALNVLSLWLAFTTPAAAMGGASHGATPLISDTAATAVQRAPSASRRPASRIIAGLSSLAFGDSLALGFGQASHMPTFAIVGIGSCALARITPTTHYTFVLLSAGTNDPPGLCIEAIRAKLMADRVEWIVPVNGARSNIIAVAKSHGDALLFYDAGPNWPHPSAYWNVLGKSPAA